MAKIFQMGHQKWIVRILITISCCCLYLRGLSRSGHRTSKLSINTNFEKSIVVVSPHYLVAKAGRRSTACSVKSSNKDGPDYRKVNQYIKKREIERLKSEGASYDELKTAIINGTSSVTSTVKNFKPGYQRLVGKGSLDQRLRAIVAYKRSSSAADSLITGGRADPESILNMSDETFGAMLDEEVADEDDDMDVEDIEDDEEALYEQLVMKAIEDSKLAELQRNFELDKAAVRENASVDEDKDLPLKTIAKSTKEKVEPKTNGMDASSGEDLYTPARSSWGVFQRPKDISKTFGGGRTITREEMQAMDDEFERREQEQKTAAKVYASETLRYEAENESKIRDALQRSRGFMGVGNRAKAVEVLEKLQGNVSWTSDLGGEVWLEYAMALETIEKSDDARKIYGQLAAISWSQKVRRNSLQLLQGLDITAKIRKDVGPRKPVVDFATMYSVSMALEEGLRNDWDDYKKDRKSLKDKIAPWFDDEMNKRSGQDLDKVVTFRDAYFLLARLMNPLKEVSSEAMSRAFRRVYIANDDEKAIFLKSQGIMMQDIPGMGKSPDSLNRQTSEPNLGAMSTPVVPFKLFADAIEDDAQRQADKLARSNLALEKRVSDVITKQLNGTWDVVTSLEDRAPYCARRFDSGSVVVSFDLARGICKEIIPVMWGMSTATLSSNLNWNTIRSEIILEGSDVSKSRVPYQKKRLGRQLFQVIFCDTELMVTRQASDKISDPDVFMLWKRNRPISWRKY